MQGSPETHSFRWAAGSKDLLRAGLLSLQRKVGLARMRQRPKYTGSGSQNRNPGRGGKADALSRDARHLRKRLKPKKKAQDELVTKLRDQGPAGQGLSGT